MSSRRQDLIEELLAQVEQLMSHRRRSFCAQPVSREVSLPQLHILSTLQESGPITVSELATLLHISAPSASSILDRMEEHGLVLRVRNVVDRRVVHVQISEHGRGVLDEIIGPKHTHLRNLLGAMTDEELEAVFSGVTAVHSALERLQEGAAAAEVEAVT